MTLEVINTGTFPNDHTGDTLKVAFEKCNANFSAILGMIPAGATIIFTPNPGGLTENLVFSTPYPLVSQYNPAPLPATGGQKTVFFKRCDSEYPVHITTDGEFAEGVDSYDLTMKGESMTFYFNSDDNKWYRG